MHITKFILSSLIYLFFSKMGMVNAFWGGSTAPLSMPESHIIFAFISIFIYEILEDAFSAMTEGSAKD
jgi:hypothetical protein